MLKKIIQNSLKSKKLLSEYKKRSSEQKKIIIALNPNDKFHLKDIAFGLMLNGEFIAATDFDNIDKNESGYISHISMLQALGKADPDKMETEFKRDERHNLVKKEYQTRGIVKIDLDNAVAFWEKSEDLLSNRLRLKIKKCLIELLNRKLITKNNLVYGTESNTYAGKVSDWV